MHALWCVPILIYLEKLIVADSNLMGKTSSPHLMRFLTVLIQWDCRKTFWEASLLTVGIEDLCFCSLSFLLFVNKEVNLKIWCCTCCYLLACVPLSSGRLLIKLLTNHSKNSCLLCSAYTCIIISQLLTLLQNLGSSQWAVRVHIFLMIFSVAWFLQWTYCHGICMVYQWIYHLDCSLFTFFLDMSKVYNQILLLRFWEAFCNSAKGDCSFLQRSWCNSTGSVWNWENSNILLWDFAATWLWSCPVPGFGFGSH